MEFNYFPAHARGFYCRMLIGHLDLGTETITDSLVQFPEFQADKHKYGGVFGQLPALKMADGELRG